MKRNTIIITIILAAVIAVVALVSYWAGKHTSTSEMKMAGNTSKASGQAKNDQRKILYWKAPMNPSEIYDHPGKSKMGMDLVPVYAGDETAEASGTVKIDPVTVQNMGVRMAMVKRADFNSTIRTVG